MPFDFQAAQSRMQAFLSSSTSPRFILFKADWCGDCVRGVPPTRAAVAAAGAPLLEIDVGDAQRWRDPNHPLRTHPSFQLQGIPTLIEYSSTEKGRYHYLGRELEKARSPEEVQRLVTAFVTAAKERQIS